MTTLAIALYCTGFGMAFLLHLMFDGGVVYATRKDGPVVGFFMAALWPIFALYILFEVIRTLFRR